MELDPPSKSVDDSQALHDSAMEFYHENRDRLMGPLPYQSDSCNSDVWMGFSLGFWSGYTSGVFARRIYPIVAVLIASTLAFAIGRGCR